jgi:hypothetical protein
LGAFLDLEASVRDSLGRLRASETLRARDKVSGFVFDIETGGLRPVE